MTTFTEKAQKLMNGCKKGNKGLCSQDYFEYCQNCQSKQTQMRKDLQDFKKGWKCGCECGYCISKEDISQALKILEGEK